MCGGLVFFVLLACRYTNKKFESNVYNFKCVFLCLWSGSRAYCHLLDLLGCLLVLPFLQGWALLSSAVKDSTEGALPPDQHVERKELDDL